MFLLFFFYRFKGLLVKQKTCIHYTIMTSDYCHWWPLCFFGFGSSRWRGRGAQLTSNSKPKLKTLGIFASCPSQDAIILHLRRFSWIDTHRIHVWYIYLHLVVFYGGIFIGKYTIHGSYGIWILSLWKKQKISSGLSWEGPNASQIKQ